MGFLSFAVPFLAAVFLVLGDFMQRGHGVPKLDMFLAGATATPAAAHAAAAHAAAAGISARPLFTAPLVEFTFHGVPVFLTIPDCLALIASSIMVVRFLAWALAPLRKGRVDD